MASAEKNDLELKFAGGEIDALKGAPAELVAASLIALQRLTYLIGMKKSGQAFGQRAKPSARVRRDYAVICKPSEPGSYIQPVTLGSQSGQFSAAAVSARSELLSALKAFDSGEPLELERVIPDPRQRWFMAEAASGLLPREDSGIQVTLRSGKRGPFSFRAESARYLIDLSRAGDPPPADRTTVVGKLKAIDFATTTLTLKPNVGRSLRAIYPLALESFLQRNVRKRLVLTGNPDVDNSGDITGFRTLERIEEVEPSGDRINQFLDGNKVVESTKPFSYLVKYDLVDRLYTVDIKEIGVSVFAERLDEIPNEISDDLASLWRSYALVDDNSLTPEAIALKANLLMRFKERP